MTNLFAWKSPGVWQTMSVFLCFSLIVVVIIILWMLVQIIELRDYLVTAVVKVMVIKHLNIEVKTTLSNWTCKLFVPIINCNLSVFNGTLKALSLCFHSASWQICVSSAVTQAYKTPGCFSASSTNLSHLKLQSDSSDDLDHSALQPGLLCLLWVSTFDTESTDTEYWSDAWFSQNFAYFLLKNHKDQSNKYWKL